MKHVRLLMIGPASGPVGGATVLFRQLVDELRVRPDVHVCVIDTARESRSFITSLIRPFVVLFRFAIAAPGTDVVSLHLSSLRMAFFAFFIWPFCILTRRPWLLRIFGDASVKHRQTSAIERVLLDWLLRRCPLLLVETHQAAEYFQPFCRRVEWYPNNRPSKNISPTLSSNPTLRFVFIGHVTPPKGIREIITASQTINLDFCVDVYGPLLDGIDASEFGGRVHYRGGIQPERISAVLASHDVLLLPTCCSAEGYPGVILEAFAAGLPVIATNWQAISEIVTPQNGILVEPRDAHSLASAMTHCILNRQLLTELSAGARQTATQFSSATWTDAYVRLTTGLAQARHQLACPRALAKLHN